MGDEGGYHDRSEPVDESIEEEDEQEQADHHQDAGEGHAEIRNEVAFDTPEEREGERERADQDREDGLLHAIAIEKPHIAGGEHASGHLHDKDGHGDHKARERGRRADDRGEDGARRRRRVLPLGRKRHRLVDFHRQRAEEHPGKRSEERQRPQALPQ